MMEPTFVFPINLLQIAMNKYLHCLAMLRLLSEKGGSTTVQKIQFSILKLMNFFIQCVDLYNCCDSNIQNDSEI